MATTSSPTRFPDSLKHADFLVRLRADDLYYRQSGHPQHQAPFECDTIDQDTEHFMRVRELISYLWKNQSYHINDNEYTLRGRGEMRPPLLSFIHGLAEGKSPRLTADFLRRSANAAFFHRFMLATENYAQCEEFLLKYRILSLRINQIQDWLRYEKEIPDAPMAPKRELIQRVMTQLSQVSAGVTLMAWCPRYRYSQCEEMIQKIDGLAQGVSALLRGYLQAMTDLRRDHQKKRSHRFTSWYMSMSKRLDRDLEDFDACVAKQEVSETKG